MLYTAWKPPECSEVMVLNSPTLLIPAAPTGVFCPPQSLVCTLHPRHRAVQAPGQGLPYVSAVGGHPLVAPGAARSSPRPALQRQLQQGAA